MNYNKFGNVILNNNKFYVKKTGQLLRNDNFEIFSEL